MTLGWREGKRAGYRRSPTSPQRMLNFPLTMDQTMSLFEFLIVILSIVIGIGISELVKGTAGLLRTYKLDEIGIVVPALAVLLLLVYLQLFWESWNLRSELLFTFPAMMLMLMPPVLINLVAHIMFPDMSGRMGVVDYYLSKSRLIWTVMTIVACLSVVFRPIAFGQPLFIMSNFSNAPALVGCIVLILSKNILLHRIVIPVGILGVIWDILAASYQIQ
jgi:hypothetical protein